MKEEMTCALMELVGDEGNDLGTAEWINLIDRGGLWHVNDEVYELFEIMELESKTIFIIADDIAEDSKKTRLTKAITENEYFLFKWSLLSSEMEDTVANILLKRMTDLYITVQGFAQVVSNFLSSLKRRHLKKALRKEIN